MAKKRFIRIKFTNKERASYRAGYKAGRAHERRIWKSMM